MSATDRYQYLLAHCQNLVAARSIGMHTYLNAVITERLHGTESATVGRAVAQEALETIETDLINAQADLFIHCTTDVMAQIK